jgi:hypothetical protein
MHLPRIAAHQYATLSELSRYVFQQRLVQLVIGFCRLLFRLDEAFTSDPGFSFCLGSMNYPRWILQRRNVELVAIAIINLGSTNAPVRGFAHAWETAKKVRCQLRHIKLFSVSI